MKTIIAPTDFSARSFHAATYAARLAADVHASLLLVNILNMPATTYGFTTDEALVVEIEEDADKELNNLRKKLLAETDSRVDIRCASDIGMVGQELETICNKIVPWLVVMANESGSILTRFFEGSHTLQAVHHIPYPVLIIPENASYHSIKKIALAHDLGSTLSRTTINHIEDWLTLIPSSLGVINITSDENISPLAALEAVHFQLQVMPHSVACHYIKRKNIEDGITTYIETHQPDLLIIIPKDKSVFHKSHSRPFLLHSTIPVLAIPQYE